MPGPISLSSRIGATVDAVMSSSARILLAGMKSFLKAKSLQDPFSSKPTRSRRVMSLSPSNLNSLAKELSKRVKIPTFEVITNFHRTHAFIDNSVTQVDAKAKNNSLESEILSISEQINRQKNRQLEVKKNEEYQALENEIISLKTKESEKEDEQIEVLVKIDDARERHGLRKTRSLKE